MCWKEGDTYVPPRRGAEVASGTPAPQKDESPLTLKAAGGGLRDDDRHCRVPKEVVTEDPGSVQVCQACLECRIGGTDGRDVFGCFLGMTVVGCNDVGCCKPACVVGVGCVIVEDLEAEQLEVVGEVGMIGDGAEGVVVDCCHRVWQRVLGKAWPPELVKLG